MRLACVDAGRSVALAAFVSCGALSWVTSALWYGRVPAVQSAALDPPNPLMGCWVDDEGI